MIGQISAPNRLRTSSEPASVMEFSFHMALCSSVHRSSVVLLQGSVQRPLNQFS